MVPPHIKAHLFAVLRALEIGIIASVMILVIIIHPGSTTASQESRRYQAQCTIPSLTILRDGQGLARGHVAVWNDTANLYVQFFADENWTLTTTHLHITPPVDTVLVTYQKMSMPRQFDAMTDHPQITSYAYTIPLTWPAFTDLTITARGSITLSGGAHQIAQTSTVWGSKLENNARQDSFDYTIRRCTDENNIQPSVPVAKADSASVVWDNDRYEETMVAAVPVHTIESSSVSDSPHRFTKAPLLDTVDARSQGQSALDDTWLGRQIRAVQKAPTNIWNHLQFTDATAWTVNVTLTNLQQPISRLMRDSLHTIKSLVMSSELPRIQASLPVLDRAHRNYHCPIPSRHHRQAE